MAVDWSSLPVDIIVSIGSNLETFDDFKCFSAVCRSWNSCSSLIKHLWEATQTVPWLLLAENPDDPNCVWRLLNICNNKSYELNLPQMFEKLCYSSPYGWIAMLDDLDLNVELFNPITKAQISFPSLNAVDDLRKLVIKKREELKYFRRIYRKLMRNSLMKIINKIIVLKVSSQGDRHKFAIMVLFSDGKRLAFARHGDQKWTSSTSIKAVNDVVVMGDNVFGLCSNGSVVYWNVNEFQRCETVKPIEYCPRPDPKSFKVPDVAVPGIYLVQSGCDLLMVLRDMSLLCSLTFDENDDSDGSDSDSDGSDSDSDGVDFKVFKLDHKNKIWEEIKDFDNATLFVGNAYSTSVSSNSAKCLKRNCIYFTDDDELSYRLISDNRFECGFGIYDNKSDKRWRLYNGDDLCYSSNYPLEWFFPQF